MVMTLDRLLWTCWRAWKMRYRVESARSALGPQLLQSAAPAACCESVRRGPCSCAARGAIIMALRLKAASLCARINGTQGPALVRLFYWSAMQRAQGRGSRTPGSFCRPSASSTRPPRRVRALASPLALLARRRLRCAVFGALILLPSDSSSSPTRCSAAAHNFAAAALPASACGRA